MKPMYGTRTLAQLKCPHRYKRVVVLEAVVTCEKTAEKCVECGKLFKIKTDCR